MPLTFGSNVGGTEEGVAIDTLVNNTIGAADVDNVISVTEATVGGVREVTLHWSDLTVYIGEEAYNLSAGSILLNNADVVNPTNYYVYIRITNGVPEVVKSLTDPDQDPSVNYNYAWLAIPRIKSVGGVATIYFVRRAYCPVNFLLHKIGEYDFQVTPEWVSGGGLTINSTTGVVDMEEVEVRRMRYETDLPLVTAGVMMYADETTTAANLEQITTYLDGSAITAGKYHKILFGRLSSPFSTNPFIIIRQSKPATEYASLDEAKSDIENVAATSFPATYNGVILPVAYIIMKKADASDLTTVDLRATGIRGSGGGGVPITDHDLLTSLGTTSHDKYLVIDGSRNLTGNMGVDAGVTVDGIDISTHGHTGAGTNGPKLDHGAALTGLTDDDHTQYLLADGSRTLSGNMAVAGGVTVDGVDISAHASNVNAHHAQSHVLATTAGLGGDHTTSGLTAGQVLRAIAATTAAFASLQAGDIPALPYLPTAGGNLTGNVTADALVTIDGVDISVHAATANAHHNAVTLSAGADTLLGLSTQQITLDNQNANVVLAGPTTGAAAAPTFRSLVAADLPSNVSVMPYAVASDTTTQSIANIANAQVVTFNTSELLSGITRTSTSRYTIVTAGVYGIILSAVANLAAQPGNKHLELWLRVDGSDVARSNTRIELVNSNVETVLAVDLVYKFTAGQYFEIWTWGDSTNCQWLATAAAAGPTRPASPSIIMTVKMISAS